MHVCAKLNKKNSATLKLFIFFAIVAGFVQDQKIYRSAEPNLFLEQREESKARILMQTEID